MLTTNPTITVLLDWLVVSAGSSVGMTVFLKLQKDMNTLTYKSQMRFGVV